MHPLLAAAVARQEPLIAFLRELVELESPSDSPAALARFADFFAESVADIATTKLVKLKGTGPAFRCDFQLPGPKRRNGRLLGVGHADTVWPIGTLSKMPWKREAGRLWGPGVLDMKGGLAFFVYACRILRELDRPVPVNVSLWVVPDEEVGSEHSRALTEKEALKSRGVLVVEPGTGLEGKCKTARKGVGDYLLKVTGKASHAGVDFSSGASAILELAHQLERIAGFTDLKRGLTVNPGVIRGGTRTNVVAAEAEAGIDIRIARMKDYPALDKKMRGLKPADPRCRLEVTGGLNRPPMERTPAIAAWYRQARQLAKQFDVVLEESATGGGSDGNFTAGLGIPTLDGIGTVGEGAHAPHESILENRIPDRVALLAALIENPPQ